MKKLLLLVALFVFITPRALIAQSTNAITYNRVIFTPPSHTTPEVFIVGASVDYAESTLTGLVEYTAHYTSFERTVEIVFSLVNKKGETIAQKKLQKVLKKNTHGFLQIASRARVFKELIRSLFAWTDKVKNTKSAEVKKNSVGVLQDIHKEIITHFKPEDLDKLGAEIEKHMSGILPDRARSMKENVEIDTVPIQDSSSMEHRVEFRRK